MPFQAPIIIGVPFRPGFPSSVTPPPPAFFDVPVRARAYSPLQPVVGSHGFLGNTPANGVLPPPLTSLDRVERKRTPPLDFFTFQAQYVIAPAPTVFPTGPFVVPIQERRRVLEALQIQHGFDVVDPPQPSVVEPERKRRPIIDAILLSGASLINVFVAPPQPNVVEPGRRRQIPAESTLLSGVISTLLGFVAPPPTQSVEPAPRKRVAPDPISINGILATLLGFVAPPRAQSVEQPEPRWRRLIHSIPTIIRGPVLAPVLNPPINVVLPVVSGGMFVGNQVSGDTGTWLYSPVSYAYQWQRATGGDYVDIAGATSNTYTLTLADVNWHLRIRVTATNADGSGVAFSLPTDSIGIAYNRVTFYH